MIFKTSLSVGGTGMLAGATHWLCAQSQQTLIVSRHADSFAARLARAAAVRADWDSADFRAILERAVGGASVEAALLWLHDPGPVLAWLAPLLKGARTVLVLGSTHAMADDTDGIAIVRLGRIGTPEKWRWLTHDEIAHGAIAALKDGRSRDVGLV